MRGKINKKIVSILFTTIIAMNSLIASFANDTINDIEGHWAELYIKDFVNKGYINGYENNTFNPNGKITRAEFISMINKVFEFNEVVDISFNDINQEQWFYEDVKKAVKAGYINGYGDNTFRPYNEITREEIAVIITNIHNCKDKNYDKIRKYKDVSKISDWAKSSIEGAVEKKYIEGYEDNTLRPKSSTTRGEAVVILSRLPRLINEKAGTILIEKDNYVLGKYEPREGTYLGAYILQDELINADMNTFENLTGKKHASYFAYLGYKTGDVEKTKKWMEEVKANGSIPHLALEPNNGLDVVKEDDYLIDLAKMFGELDIPIYLRFASEMNGDWVAWNGDPNKYIEKWKLVHDVMEKYAPKVMMLWTPFTTPQNSIMKYYPGDEYVDWVGVNVYNVVYHNNRLDQPAMHEDPLELLDYVYDTFSARKPIQISEYGATHYTITDDKYYVDFAISKITRMYEGIYEKYPRIKSIFYFDVNNLINAPEGRKINNYAITDEPRITKAYKDLISSNNFLDHIKPDESGKIDKEIFTLADEILEINNTKYINIHNINTILGGDLEIANNLVKYSLNNKEYILGLYKHKNNKYFVKLDDFSKNLGYKIENRGTSETLVLKKI